MSKVHVFNLITVNPESTVARDALYQGKEVKVYEIFLKVENQISVDTDTRVRGLEFFKKLRT